MSERSSIGELDLLAYADDPLGLEPQRRQAVEEHLDRHPDDAVRVEVFRRQNLALRERYDRYFHAPVPQRLYDALEDRPAGGRRLLRHTAAACVIAAAVGAGWLAGDRYGGPALDGLDEARTAVHQGEAPAELSEERQPAGPVAVAGLLEYGAGLPDLGQIGFSLVEASPAAGSSGEAARLTYADEDGRRFTLTLRSRWHDRNPGFQVEKREGLSIVSWEEGRLAAELTSEVDREEALEIAEAVRSSLASVTPASPVPADGLLAAGSAQSAEAIDGGGPLLPQQVR